MQLLEQSGLQCIALVHSIPMTQLLGF